MIGRLWPRDDGERQAAIDAGYDLDEVLDVNRLVAGADVFFAATGVTEGDVLEGVHYTATGATTESLVMRSRSGTVRRISAPHDRAKPREIAFFKAPGKGVHRFTFDGRYAYISPTMEGYVGNIAMILDLKNPEKPEEVCRWWMPGQWTAGGETPTWHGMATRCHHPIRKDDRLYISYWHGGFAIVDIGMTERATWPRQPAAWAAEAVRTIADREARVTIPAGTVAAPVSARSPPGDLR